MFKTKLDHLVVAAASIDQGVDYVRRKLGVDVPAGGQHEQMGTHNHVMSLGDGVYLEIIAINPQMDAPARPRWFGLDDPFVRHALQQSPRLITWAVNTTDLDILTANSLHNCGEIHEMHRDDLEWKVAITDDGRLPAAGFLPLTIQWKSNPHPSGRMADLGCRITALALYHPRPAWITRLLKSINADNLVQVVGIDDMEMPNLAATLQTPNGTKILSSNLTN
jgi:hypothetical protein